MTTTWKNADEAWAWADYEAARSCAGENPACLSIRDIIEGSDFPEDIRVELMAKLARLGL